MPASRGLPWVLCLALLLAAACRQETARLRETVPRDAIVKQEREMMDTIIGIQVLGLERKAADAAMDAAFREIQRLEALAHPFREGSDIDRLNQAAGREPVALSPEIFGIMQVAMTVSEQSAGAFDITFAGVGRLWNYKDPAAPLPSAAQIRQALALVGYRHLKLDENGHTALLDRQGMRVGLGGIAKGWATDRAGTIMKRQGVVNGIVKAGGDMTILGSKNGKPWQIGIQHPRKPRESLYAVLSILGPLAISTSGDYERFIMRDGIRYHHILDPHTGLPARASQSVTVLAPNGVISDALSTALFVLGPEKGLALLARYYPQCDALWIDGDGREHVSPDFISRTQIRREKE